MIRPVTMLAFLAFIGSGLYLYQVKHQAQLVDRQIRQTEEATQAARARAGVLRAEYALLNDPDRLAALAAAYVPDLKPTQPAQWSSMAEIDRRLPPVDEPGAEPAAPGPRGEPMARIEPLRPPPQAVAAAPAPASPPVVVAAVREPATPSRPVAAPPARPAPRPVALAARTPLRPARITLARSQSAAPPPPVVVRVAAVPPRPVASLLPRVSAPAGGSLLAIAARPAPRDVAYVAPPATPAEAVARIARGGPVDPSVPMVASALGMARTMMSVTPVSSASAGTLYPPGTAR